MELSNNGPIPKRMSIHLLYQIKYLTEITYLGLLQQTTDKRNQTVDDFIQQLLFRQTFSPDEYRKVNRKVQKEPLAEAAANPGHQEEGKK